MENKVITIGPGTDINLVDLIQSRMLIQGNSGSGKSGLARKIIEGTFQKVPFVVWDIEGEYYTLKELSSDIVIIGGQYADVPITMGLAEKLPAFIIKNRLSVVVDLSDFKMSERIRFSQAFYETLMDLTMEYWTPYFFFLEECQKLAGEQEKQDSTTAIKDLLSRGRKRGYCAIVITQRIGMLNKSVAAECNAKFIGKTVLDIDIDRSAKELGFSKAADRLKLRELKRGHFYAYGSSLSPEHVHEVVVDKPKTTMVKAGMNIDFKAPKPTAKMLEMLTKLAEATSEEKILRQKDDANSGQSEEISVLADQLNQTKAYVFELQNEITELERLRTDYAKLAADRGVRLTRLYQIIEDNREIIHEFAHLIKGDESNMQDVVVEEKPKETLPSKLGKSYPTNNGHASGAITSGDGAHTEKVLAVLKEHNHAMFNGSLSGGEKKILTACAQYPKGLERYQLTIMAGYKQSARDTYISRLKQKGYVDQSGARIVATAAGKKALGRDYQPLPTGRRLAEYWLSRLSGGEQKILVVAINAYPQSVSRDLISQRTQYKQSARDTYISRLAGRELIMIPSKGMVKASDFLFD